MYIRFYYNTCDSSYYNHNIEIIGFLPIDVFIVEQNAMSCFFLLSGGSASADAWIFFFTISIQSFIISRSLSMYVRRIAYILEADSIYYTNLPP